MEALIKTKVDAWLNGPLDEASKKTLREMVAKEDPELTECFYKDLEFGTGGLRGLMGIGTNRMNDLTVGMATQGFATYLQNSFQGPLSVAIAYDSRNNSAAFARKAAEVFSGNGIKVYLFAALRPTPELSFAVRQLGCQGGVVITASHNPKEYNGYKVYWNDGAQVVAPHDKNIIASVGQIKNLADVKWQPRNELILTIGEDMDIAYFARLKTLSLYPELIAKHKEISIVYTSIHGTGITTVPPALHEFGFRNIEVVKKQAIPDGNFPTVIYPNPEEAEALAMAVNEAIAIKAELVLATDPDADRVGIAVRDDAGKFILLNGNQTGTLLLYYLLSAWKAKNKLTGKQYVVKTIVTTELIRKIADSFKVECDNVLTGFKFIAELLRQNEGKKEFIGGGEESYGYLAGDFVRDKDAVGSACLIAEMTVWAKEQGLTPYQLLKKIYVEYGCYQEDLLSLTKKGRTGVEEIAQMMKTLRTQPPVSLAGSKVILIADYLNQVEKDLRTGATKEIQLPKSDVLQFFVEDGSVITARPSGTEPKIKFYFGAVSPLKTERDYEKVSLELKGKIEKFKKDLNLN